jgi:hypothetical protein
MGECLVVWGNLAYLANVTVIAMRECLNCKIQYQEKRSTSKFCSNKCRAAYNRGNPTHTVSKTQLQVLYKEMLDLIQKAKSEPQQPYIGVVTKDEVKWGQSQEPVKITLKAPSGPPDDSNADIQKKIDEIKKEKIPKERDTVNGRKAWALDQKKRIEDLKNKLK